MNRIRARGRLRALRARLRRGYPSSYALRRILRALLGKFSNRTHEPPAVAAAVAPAEIARIEAEVPRVALTFPFPGSVPSSAVLYVSCFRH